MIYHHHDVSWERRSCVLRPASSLRLDCVHPRIFAQGAANYLVSEGASVNPDLLFRIMDQFGSVERAMLTLWKTTSGGADWEIFLNTLIPTGPQNVAFFILFVVFIQIALLNILTGIFVENAMKLAQPDRDTLAIEQRKKDIVEAKELSRVCREIDADNSGFITEDEFSRFLVNDKLKAHLAVLGLDIRDAEFFFDLLAEVSDNEGVDIDVFVAGCMRLKGYATSIDLQSLLYETKVMHKSQKQFFLQCEALLKIAFANTCSGEVAPAGASVMHAGWAEKPTTDVLNVAIANANSDDDTIAGERAMHAGRLEEATLDVAAVSGEALGMLIAVAPVEAAEQAPARIGL